MTDRQTLILDSTVISNFAYTDCVETVSETFPDVRTTSAVLDEIQDGYNEGHEFLQNALEVLPDPKSSSTENDPPISRTLSIMRGVHHGKPSSPDYEQIRVFFDDEGREFDRETVQDLIDDCLEEIERGEASVILDGYITNSVIATDDQDARRLARRYAVDVTGSLGILKRSVNEDLIDVETANSWLTTWIEENEYYSPVDDIEDLD